MKVVILAAGKGSRLGQGNLPKPLTVLSSGKSILAHQLDAIKLHTALKNILIVVGYHQEEIMGAFPQLSFVSNPLFASTNTSKSLLLALKQCDEDVIWINGDVVFHESVLKAILTNPRTSMVVNVGPVGEEEVKYRQDAHGKILEVSKHVSQPQGEALGINYCQAADMPRFCEALKQCDDKDYFERAIETCIEDGMAVWSVPVNANLCTEIDFPQDLQRANAMLSSWA